MGAPPGERWELLQKADWVDFFRGCRKTHREYRFWHRRVVLDYLPSLTLLPTQSRLTLSHPTQSRMPQSRPLAAMAIPTRR